MSRKPILALVAAALLAPTTVHAQRIVTPTGDLPVIQQVQLVFSMVSHLSHVPNRVSFYNTYGQPVGNSNYAVPHLVCDPLITLYNPHPTPLTLNSVRVRIDDPPVGFRFQKNGVYLRSDYAAGSFLGLARLQITNQFNSNARKSITLELTSPGSTGVPGNPIILQPGETRLFSPWIESSWTWGQETSGGYVARQFFDWDNSADLTNRDKRTNNNMGVECVGYGGFPSGSWDPRAGFQWDFLASSSRATNTLYSFEALNNWGDGWVAIKMTDSVSVESSALRVFPDSLSDPDFRISLLAGRSTDPTRDVYQQFSFDADSIIRFAANAGVVSRVFHAGDILQSSYDFNPGGKAPFAVLTATARRDSLASGELEEVGLFDGDRHYETRFDEAAYFFGLDSYGYNQTDYPPVPFVQPFATNRTTSGLFHVAVASPGGPTGWTIRGGTSPGAMTHDLTGVADIVPLPSYLFGSTKLHRITLDTSTLGDHYFIQLVEP